MIIDFRCRPPFKSFLNMRQFKAVSPHKKLADESFLTYGRNYNPSAAQGSLKEYIREMNAAGITRAVVMPRVNDKIAAEPVKNDDAIELAALYPDRFIPFAGIDPSSPEAVTEVERCSSLGCKGISMDPGFLAMHADDPRIDPVYALCEEKHLIASVASSGLIGPDMSYCDPLSINRISLRFPRLKIVVPHACWPNTGGALCAAALSRNIYLIPDSYMYTHMAFYKEILSAAETWFKGNLLFASSYPLQSLAQTVAEWRKLPLGQEAMLQSLYYNAAELLDL